MIPLKFLMIIIDNWSRKRINKVYRERKKLLMIIIDNWSSKKTNKVYKERKNEKTRFSVVKATWANSVPSLPRVMNKSRQMIIS